MGLMKNQAILHFGREKEPSIALGSISIRKALIRPTPEIFIAGNKHVWCYLITNNDKIKERTKVGKFYDPEFSREIALAEASIDVNIRLNDSTELKPIVKLFTKHKKLFNWTVFYWSRHYPNPRYNLQAELIKSNDNSRDYFLARVEYLLDHPEEAITSD